MADNMQEAMISRMAKHAPKTIIYEEADEDE